MAIRRLLPLFLATVASTTACTFVGATVVPTPARPTARPASVSATPSPAVTATPPPSPSPSTRRTPPASPMATRGRIVDTEAGYAVTLPKGWLRLDLTTDMREILRDEIDKDTDLAALSAWLELYDGESLEDGVSMLAIRLKTIDFLFPTGVLIISAPSLGMSLDTVEQINLAQLRRMTGVAGAVHSERVELPVGSALYVRYKLELEPGFKPVNMHQYLFVEGGRQHLITVSGMAKDNRLDKQAAAIARSFEFLPAD